MDPLQRRKAISDMYVSWISLIGVAVAVVVGFHTYFSNQNELSVDRYKTTLGYVERYNSDQMLVFREQIQKAIDHAWDQNVNLLINDSPYDNLQDFYRANIGASLKAEDAFSSFSIMVQFYDELWTCVEVELCDRETTFRFFSGEAEQFRSVFDSMISAFQFLRPDYGFGLSQLAVRQQEFKGLSLPEDY
jgi:hypothetical protein